MNYDETLKFCIEWLNAWTGNKPNELLNFYDKDCYYQDPANPEGLNCHNEIMPYFKKLLAANPSWKWKIEEVFLTEKGFNLKWKASIPIGTNVLIEHGMDIVEIKNQKITRNEVYFDRTSLLEMLKIKRT